MKNRVYVTFLCILAVLFLYPVSGFSQQNEVIVVDQRQITKTYDMEADSELRVENQAGDVKVTGWTGSKIQIDIFRKGRWDDFEVYIDKRSKRFVVEVEYPDRDRRRDRWGNYDAGSIDLEIKVPEKSELDLYSMNGSVEVEGIKAYVNARALNGGVEVRKVESDVDAHSTNSSVKVSDVQGSVDARSTNSRVIVRDVTGNIEARSVNSRVEVFNVKASRVDAGSVNSGVDVDLNFIDPRGQYELSSTNGSVRITIPADAKADVTARARERDLHSDFDLFDEERERDRRSSRRYYYDDRNRRRTFRGVLNGGGARIYLSTTHGDVDIRKR